MSAWQTSWYFSCDVIGKTISASAETSTVPSHSKPRDIRWLRNDTLSSFHHCHWQTDSLFKNDNKKKPKENGGVGHSCPPTGYEELLISHRPNFSQSSVFFPWVFPFPLWWLTGAISCHFLACHLTIISTLLDSSHCGRYQNSQLCLYTTSKLLYHCIYLPVTSAFILLANITTM